MAGATRQPSFRVPQSILDELEKIAVEERVDRSLHFTIELASYFTQSVA